MTEVVVAPVAGQVTPEAGVQQTAEGVKPEAQGGAPIVDPATTADPAAAVKPAEGETKTGEAEVVYAPVLPEGMPVDEIALTQLVEVAKTNKWSPETVQQLVDLRAGQVKAEAAAFSKEVAGWEAAVKADPDLGGDKLEATLANGRRAIDLGPPELKALLHSSRMGSHPAVVKWMNTIGRMVSEDASLVKGGNGPSTSADTAKALYPNQS
jgi:hypothetical protein